MNRIRWIGFTQKNDYLSYIVAYLLKKLRLLLSIIIIIIRPSQRIEIAN